MKGKTIAVTGGSGFIGQHLIRRLLARNNRIKVLIHQNDIKEAEVEKFYGSVNDQEVLFELMDGADVLFHLASALGNRLLSREEFKRVNVEGVRHILKTAQVKKVKKVVCFSSAGVYGKSSGLRPLSEDGPLNPVDIYEQTKLAGEKEALVFKDKLDLSIIRPGWVFGEGDKRTFKLIKQINSGFFFIVGRGIKKHSPIHVSDLIDGALLVAERGGKGEVYNLGGDPCSITEMVQIIAQSLEKKIFPFKCPVSLIYPMAFLMETFFKLFRKEAPLNVAKLAFFLRGKPLNSTKIKQDLGFTNFCDFKNKMFSACRWYKNNNWL